MVDGKFITTILALVFSAVAICNLTSKKTTTSHESFGLPGHSFTHRKSTMRQDKNGVMYSIPGNYQSALAPRMFSGQYQANVNKQNLHTDFLAVPDNPTTWEHMVEEDYSADKDYNITEDNKENTEQNSNNDYSNSLPTGDMKNFNSLGEEVNSVNYERLIFSNRNSRTRSQGDMIRGDLPIVPCQTGWFRPSANPSTDLQQGAMNVLTDSLGSQKLASLISGNSADTTFAGAPLESMQNYNSENQMLQAVSFI